MSNIRQGAIVYIDFELSKGSEITKRRPAVVISRDEYNRSSNLVILCPITSTRKDRPYFVDLSNPSLSQGSKVNTKQVYSLDVTVDGGSNVEVIGQISKKELIDIAQHFLLNFNFQL